VVDLSSNIILNVDDSCLDSPIRVGYGSVLKRCMVLFTSARCWPKRQILQS